MEIMIDKSIILIHLVLHQVEFNLLGNYSKIWPISNQVQVLIKIIGMEFNRMALTDDAGAEI